jgi:hypothetical protein
MLRFTAIRALDWFLIERVNRGMPASRGEGHPYQLGDGARDRWRNRQPWLTFAQLRVSRIAGGAPPPERTPGYSHAA